jgi:hypothetical protein
VVLERATVAPEAVEYRAVLYTPTVAYTAVVRVAADGRVDFGDFTPPDPPPWLVGLAQAFLRSEWRARQGVADPPPWPARISRWRDEKKGPSFP